MKSRICGSSARPWKRANTCSRHEFEQREKAKFKELDERLRSALAGFEAQTQQTIQKVLSGAEQRKAAEQAERRLAKDRREFEEQARVAVFGAAPVPQQRFIPIEEGDRVRLKGVREPARVRRKLSGWIARSGSGSDADEDHNRRCGGGFARGAGEQRDYQRMFPTKPDLAGMSPIARSM